MNLQAENLMRPPVAPYLTVSPALAAITFYTSVFNARQRALIPEFGQTRVPLPGELAAVSVSLEYAEAKMVDEIFAKATSLGAKGETNPTNSFWGTRVATFRDPFGHRWILNAPLA
jgi:PhnB protein